MPIRVGDLSPDGQFFWDGGQWTPAARPDAGQQFESGLHFLRSERRVALLLMVANLPYLLWWLWRLFKFAQHERFPRARSFWWILMPFYGFVVVWRTVGDLVQKERESTGTATTSAKVTWFYIFSSGYGGSANYPGWLDVAIAVVNAAFVAIFGFKVQTSANNYLRATYPGATPRGWTAGEVFATVLGILVSALAVVGVLLPSS